MAEVWAAEQPITRTGVAIKLLRADISKDRHHVARFFREAVAVSRIKHAGIVKIFDVGVHAGRAFLIMELLEGETLASRIKRAGWLPVGDVADIGRQVTSILAAMHAAGITHRDLKPDNLFLTPDTELASRERVKLLDFGIARLGLGVTAPGASMGTPAYMAPEQWNNAANADARADVYSLGCLVFEMCCGRPPFVARSIGEAYTKHQHEPPPRASSLVPGLSREVDDLIARMLSKSPADRPAVRDIGTAFTRLSVGQPRLLDTTVPPPPRPCRLRAMVIAAAIAGLAKPLLGYGFLG